jgi:hypothetical protein
MRRTQEEIVMRIRILIIAVLIAVIPVCLSFAGGAGGMFFGVPYFDPYFSNYDLPIQCMGGYGYGVSSDGQRYGGFGMGFFGGSALGGFSGGVGGVLSGQEFRLGSFVLAVNLLTGIGGLGTDAVGVPGGYLIAFGQIDAEVGIVVWPWMQISGYGGMQAFANLLPGNPLQDVLYYTPVVGVRLAWGSFPSRSRDRD